MKETKEIRNTAIRYLFGELSEGELDRFEDRLFSDEELSHFVTNVENDLIDEYLRNELKDGDLRRFESRYLNSDSRRRKLAAARTLHSNLFEESEFEEIADPSRPTFWESFAAVFRMPRIAVAGGLGLVAITLFTGGLLLFRGIQERESSNGVASNKTDNRVVPAPEFPSLPLETSSIEPDSNSDTGTTSANAPNPGKKTPRADKEKSVPKPARRKALPSKRTTERHPPQRVLAFSLFPPIRSSEKPVLDISTLAKSVRITLFDNFGEEYVRYMVELKDAEENTIWSRQIKASGPGPQRSLVFGIDADNFKTGTYEFGVIGITADGSVEELNFYNFEVRRQ